MGFNNRAPKKFVSITNGKLTYKVPPGTKGAVERVNKENKVVHEIVHNEFSGYLIGFNHRQPRNPKFPLEFIIELQDDGPSKELVTIVTQYSSRYTAHFLNCCPNIDIKKPVCFRTYQFKPQDREKPINGWLILQGDQKIMPVYPKDSPELPPLKKVMVRGAAVYDDTERMLFLWDKAAEWGLSVGLFGGSSEPDADNDGIPVPESDEVF